MAPNKKRGNLDGNRRISPSTKTGKNEKRTADKQLKQSSLLNYISRRDNHVENCPKKCTKRGKRKRVDLDSKFIDSDGWIETDNKKCVDNTEPFRKKETSDHNENISKEPKGAILFDKCGIKSPCFENILDRKQDLTHKKERLNNMCLKELAVTESVEQSKETDSDILSLKMLDCKHLSSQDLLNAFNTNLKYITDIVSSNRQQDHNRHSLVHKLKLMKYPKNLARSTSMTTFDYKQKQQLLKLLQEQFCESTPSFLTQLLSEMCLKIFMDVHNMSFKNAVEYLHKHCVEL